MVQDDVYREAVTDGYLIDTFFLNSLTTESSKRPVAFQPSQQPLFNSKESDITEGSGATSTFVETFVETFVHHQHGGEHHGTTPQSSTSSVSPGDITGSGSGDGEIIAHSTGSTMTPISNTETSTASSDSTPVLNRGIAPRVMTKATEGLGTDFLVPTPKQGEFTITNPIIVPNYCCIVFINVIFLS